MLSVSGSSEYRLFRTDSPRNASLRPSEGVLGFSAFGVPFGVRTNQAEIASHLFNRLPPRSISTSEQIEVLYTLNACSENFQVRETNAQNTDAIADLNGHYELARTTRLSEALEIFESDLQLHVAENCRNKVFVHAGVVEWNGKAIVVPGASCAGKTTLITSLVRAGATYYSDEYALFDDEGRVHAYPRLPRVRTAEGKSQIVQAEMFKTERELEPLVLGYIVVTQHVAGGEWRPRTLSPGQAVLSLLQNTVAIRRRPDSCLRVLSRAGQSAVAMQSARGEADETALLILNEIESNKTDLSSVRETLNTF